MQMPTFSAVVVHPEDCSCCKAARLWEELGGHVGFTCPPNSFTLTTSEFPELEFRLQRLRSLDYRQSLEARYLDLMSDGSFAHVFFVVLNLMNEEALLQRGQMGVGKMAFWIQLLQIYLLLHTYYQQLGVIRRYDTLLSLFFKIFM